MLQNTEGRTTHARPGPATTPPPADKPGRNHQGKVRQEHVAALGSVPPDMTPADRLEFWTRVHPRLARLDNRFDSATRAKVLGELHAKVPMVMPSDPGIVAHKVGIAGTTRWP